MIGMVRFKVSLMVIMVTIAACVNGEEFYDHNEVDVQMQLKRLRKPAIKTIKSEDGDIIDCVPIKSQAALDHPLLKNHTVEMRPSFIPKGAESTNQEAKNITQIWHKSGVCPKNTAAIRRTKKEEILRKKTMNRIGKKTHQSIPGDQEDAIMSSQSGNFYGTKFAVNMWRPYVENPQESSSAQTWLVSGSNNGLNTIEAGWQVYPGMYGDNKIRLFVYWTANGYHGKGCYNTACSGFVQISNRITVGGSLAPMSQYNSAQYDLPMLVWKSGSDNWWLMIGDEYVGYWPGSLFSGFKNGVELVQWGGEIVNMMTNGRHTKTDMGSGHFAEEGFKKASYFRNLETVDGSNFLREPEGHYPWASNSKCYSVKPVNDGSSFGNHFYFGGPGRNSNCP